MRNRYGILFLLLGTALLFSPISIQAACTQADVGGTWRVFAMNNTPQWLSCTVRIDAVGTIASGSNCTTSEGNQYPINGGKLTLKPGCTFSGQFGLSDGYGTRIFLDSGAMGRDKIYVEGVGHDNWQGIFKFSGVKK